MTSVVVGVERGRGGQRRDRVADGLLEGGVRRADPDADGHGGDGDRRGGATRARVARGGRRLGPVRGTVLVVVLGPARSGEGGDDAPAEEECGGPEREPVALGHPEDGPAHVGDPHDSDAEDVVDRHLGRVGLTVGVALEDELAVGLTALQPVGAGLAGVVGVGDGDDLALGQLGGRDGAGHDDVAHVDPGLHRAGHDHPGGPAGEQRKQRPQHQRDDEREGRTGHADPEHLAPAGRAAPAPQPTPWPQPSPPWPTSPTTPRLPRPRRQRRWTRPSRRGAGRGARK